MVSLLLICGSGTSDCMEFVIATPNTLSKKKIRNSFENNYWNKKYTDMVYVKEICSLYIIHNIISLLLI